MPLRNGSPKKVATLKLMEVLSAKPELALRLVMRTASLVVLTLLISTMGLTDMASKRLLVHIVVVCELMGSVPTSTSMRLTATINAPSFVVTPLVSWIKPTIRTTAVKQV